MMTSWYERPFVSFDTETSGIDVETARIVSAAVVTIDPATGTTEIREWLTDVDGQDIPAEATAVHGITTEHAREHGRPVAEVAREIVEALADAWFRLLPVVAYNASYDLSLLDREMRRHNIGALEPAAVIDPLVLDKHYDRYRRGSRKLTATAKHYGIDLSEQDAHGATADALAAKRAARAAARAETVIEFDTVPDYKLREEWTHFHALGVPDEQIARQLGYTQVDSMHRSLTRHGIRKTTPAAPRGIEEAA